MRRNEIESIEKKMSPESRGEREAAAQWLRII